MLVSKIHVAVTVIVAHIVFTGSETVRNIAIQVRCANRNGT